MPTITAQINFLGAPITEAEIDDLLAGNQNQSLGLHLTLLSSFFALNAQTLPREVLVRFADLSSLENYYPIVPHTQHLIGRLFGPLKSAKRCYCLEEFLATIELSAHVAEMLAVLLWEMTPVTYNGSEVEQDFEKDVLGSEFEKLGQERRVKVLKGFSLLTLEQVELFTFIRKTRSKYFHLWFGDFLNIKQDAKDCYLKINRLIKEILQIGISQEQPGTIAMNPLLIRYMEAHGQALDQSDSPS